MPAPRVIGVRHHSPACARLVEAEIARLRPRAVLIEAPADLDVEALALPHTPPIAALSWFEGEDHSTGSWAITSWAPFCAHSPELVALRAGRAVDAEVRFIDLPVWAQPWRVRTPRLPSAYERALLARTGMDDRDALWDHLFEAEDDLSSLATRLEAHWRALRADAPPDARERFMAAHVAHAVSAAGSPERVLVVCGGMHAPFLATGWRGADGARPALPDDGGARRGTELVSWSDARLDGYEAGLPAPAWYRAVWERGPEGASAQLLEAAARRVRSRRALGAADVAAARAMMLGLARLRGHAAPTRSDFLEALIATWVKAPLDRPLGRGSVEHADDVILAEIHAALRGDREGALAPGLGPPSLLREAREAARAGDPEGLRCLHVLRTPGIHREDGAFVVRWGPESEAHVVREAVRGATLSRAAASRALEALRDREPGALAAALSLGPLDAEGRDAARRAIEDATSLDDVGDDLRVLMGAGAEPELLRAATRHAAWLIEGRSGPRSEIGPRTLDAVVALRDALRAQPEPDVDETLRRVARDGRAPWLLRGACLGVLEGQPEELDALPPEGVGLVLAGLLSVRPEVSVDALLDALDPFVVDAPEDALLEALPGLRLAFSRLPRPRRAALAERAGARHATRALDPAAGRALEVAVDAEMARWGLAPAPRQSDAAPSLPASGGATSGDAASGVVEAKAAPHRDAGEARARWRLALGDAAHDALGDPGRWRRHDEALSFLYDRTDAKRGDVRVPTARWLEDLHALFEARVAADVERDAIRRFGLDEVLAAPELLARAAPDPALLDAVLRRGPRMDEAAREVALAFVRRTAAALRAALAPAIEAPFTGASGARARDGARHRFDAGRTVRRNLRHWDPVRGKLIVVRPAFTRRARRPRPWTLLVLVDRSGSMREAAAMATVTAACFASLPSVRAHLLAFGADVVDLSDRVEDPGAALFDAADLPPSLSGGTDIGRALAHAASLVRTPRRTLVVLVTDFREGVSRPRVVRRVEALVRAGVTVLGLAALDADAVPDFDRALAQRCASAGAHVGAMSPGELARFVAERVRG